MALEDRAANFALKLRNENFGKRPIIFVAHSMGGLIVKEFMTPASGETNKEWSEIADAVRGIVFLGTPHHGAEMASVAKGFAVLLRTQEHLKQMEFARISLDQLHKRFIKWQAGTKCPVVSFVETQGIARSGFFSRFLPRIFVVPRISGDPNLHNCECHPIGADHISLVKPDGPNHDVYGGVLCFIKRPLICLQLRAQLLTKFVPAKDIPPPPNALASVLRDSHTPESSKEQPLCWSLYSALCIPSWAKTD